MINGLQRYNIIAVGGGGHAKVLIGILKSLSQYRLIGYTDNANRGDILGIPYLGPDQILGEMIAQFPLCNAALGVGKISIGDNRIRLLDMLSQKGFRLPTIVSPYASVSEDVLIGMGSVVFTNAVINPGTIVGKGSILNTNSTVEHDCQIGDDVHIAPGATISGGVFIGKGCIIGTGANIIQGIHIAEYCFVGAGAVVICDLLRPGIYAGNPARQIHPSERNSS